MSIPVVKEVPVPDLNHPDPKYDMLPKHEVSFYLILVHDGFCR